VVRAWNSLCWGDVRTHSVESRPFQEWLRVESGASQLSVELLIRRRSDTTKNHTNSPDLCHFWSNLKTAPVSTLAPFAQSSFSHHSSGWWLTSSLHGTKTIAVGHLRLAKTLSWPAPLVILQTRFFWSVAFSSRLIAAASTQLTASGWNLTAFEYKFASTWVC
jgi:hypothetical protein